MEDLRKTIPVWVMSGDCVLLELIKLLSDAQDCPLVPCMEWEKAYLV